MERSNLTDLALFLLSLPEKEQQRLDQLLRDFIDDLKRSGLELVWEESQPD